MARGRPSARFSWQSNVQNYINNKKLKRESEFDLLTQTPSVSFIRESTGTNLRETR